MKLARRRSNDDPFGFGSFDFDLGLGNSFKSSTSSNSGKRVPRDTRNYTLRHHRRKVYVGISNDPERRIRKHVRDGKKFTSCTVSSACSRETAFEREKIAINTYENNKGKKPGYNKVS
jgi:predicted GIY-YIG superfamily endonuclease